jgi:hypothetical protein
MAPNPTNDLSPTAEAFILDLAAWLPEDELERARVGLAGLLAGERGEERERGAARIRELEREIVDTLREHLRIDWRERAALAVLRKLNSPGWQMMLEEEIERES